MTIVSLILGILFKETPTPSKQNYNKLLNENTDDSNH